MTEPTAQPEAPEGEPKAKGGRPSLFSDEIANAICERLAQGEPLARICEDESMPAFRTVFRWETDKPEFGQLSARAREIGTHYMADDCIRIADDKTIDPADKRIQIDTRIRLIGKWNRKNYGDKLAVGGDDDAPPIKTELSGNVTIDPALVLKAMRELDAET